MRGPLVVAAVVLMQALPVVQRSSTADEGTFRCALKEAVGVPEADARTATGLLCDELRRASGGRGEFEVSLGTLGRLVLVTVARQDTRMSLTVQADGLEELPVAAGRIASALAKGRSFSSTERVDNLVASETRKLRTKSGSVKFSLGVADVETPGHGARGSGLVLGLAYAAPRLALPAEMRFGWGNANDSGPHMDLFSISVGGRAYLSTRDISPFAGGGLGYTRLTEIDHSTSSGHFAGRRGGIAPYLEGGVEFLRTHRGHLGLQVRADFPTGSLESPSYDSYYYEYYPYGYAGDGHGVTVPSQKRYIVPVSIGLNVTF